MVKVVTKEADPKITQTPILVFVEDERSVTIAKFITKDKEYVVKATRDGKLIMN